MKIRIGSIEIVDPTMDELDELIKRYGGSIIEPQADQKASKTVANTLLQESGAGTADAVLLKHFVEAGNGGHPAKDVGDLLGRRGRRLAGRRRHGPWGRIGLVGEESQDAFDECRVGTQRALRIKASF